MDTDQRIAGAKYECLLFGMIDATQDSQFFHKSILYRFGLTSLPARYKIIQISAQI